MIDFKLTTNNYYDKPKVEITFECSECGSVITKALDDIYYMNDTRCSICKKKYRLQLVELTQEAIDKEKKFAKYLEKLRKNNGISKEG